MSVAAGMACFEGAYIGANDPRCAPCALPPATRVWVVGVVIDASTSLPVAGVTVAGADDAVVSDDLGGYALYARVVNDRVIVQAAEYGNYSAQTGTAVYHPGVTSYVIPLRLNPLTIHRSFVPAVGLPRFTIPDVYGRNVYVRVPPFANPALLPSPVTLSIAVVLPGECLTTFELMLLASLMLLECNARLCRLGSRNDGSCRSWSAVQLRLPAGQPKRFVRGE